MKTIDEFAKEHKQLLRQEELILDATELISKIMKDNSITKAELAARLGKSKAFVTQCLCGHQNLTLRTLADIFTVLGYQANFGAEPCSVDVKTTPRLYPVKHWAFEVKHACEESTAMDFAANAIESEEDYLCDVA
jgi:transcriptional regulator with XRE-family HTH domain